MDELTVTCEEGGGDPKLVTSWVFRRWPEGEVRIIENWPDKEEIWSDGHGITLPPKAAALFIAWLTPPPAALAPEPHT